MTHLTAIRCTTLVLCLVIARCTAIECSYTIPECHSARQPRCYVSTCSWGMVTCQCPEARRENP